MAAPTKEIKRDDNIQVKLYSKEKEDLKKMLSGTIHSNMSEMVRSVLFKGELKVVTVDRELENRNALLLQQARNIGNNFNQFIRLLHSKKLNYFTTSDVNNIRSSLEEIVSIYSSIEQYFMENGSKNS